ncbi:hypothetical protein MKK68_12580 [Methylobacterium sp. E-016]|uniref:hypothetical protein n=1 Tax=Methylobacterium sp. E-016 TaxID=2836556 RepID=UPI001FB98EAE|nr:hypothetical protein [Methylobacterium sp. E-016]MCJ2076479.1 hypothetical protein [Methylobacterium sp. E-016]
MVNDNVHSLQAIADALGLPVEAFAAGAQGDRAQGAGEREAGAQSAGELGELASLLQLWLSVRDPQARRRVLNAMRGEAERPGSGG